MKISIRHGGKIECDIVDDRGAACAVSFVSYSVQSMTRRQAIEAGWGRIKLNMLADWKDLELGSDGRRLLDACPMHKEIVKREHAVWLLEADKRKAAAKIEARQERTRMRATLAQDKRDKRESDKLAKIAAKEAAKAARNLFAVAVRERKRLAKQQEAATRAALQDPVTLHFIAQRGGVPLG